MAFRPSLQALTFDSCSVRHDTEHGYLEEALDAFAECLDIAPSHHGALSARATTVSELGRREEARWVCEKLVRMVPEDPQVRANLGIILERLGYFEAALAAYDRVLDFAPISYAAQLNRGYVLNRLGRLEEALENNMPLRHIVGPIGLKDDGFHVFRRSYNSARSQVSNT